VAFGHAGERPASEAEQARVRVIARRRIGDDERPHRLRQRGDERLEQDLGAVEAWQQDERGRHGRQGCARFVTAL